MKGRLLGVYLIIPILVFLWVSCSDKQKEDIVHLVEHWKGKEIKFPVATTFIQGKDTVDYSMEAQYKILSYVDSTGCVSCKLKLAEWKNFISVIDSVNPLVKVWLMRNSPWIPSASWLTKISCYNGT